ncbi:MAG: nuclear transport factor 2 family protein [Betaproteobacteria bacterium]|nr:nuclear transport factor 2 family protein [Betaproteobacteria bacterium]
MDAADGAVLEWQCQKAVMAFFRCLDERDNAGLLARMHPEGVWLRQGKQLKGEEQILEALRARSETMRIHHVLTNVLVDVDIGSGRASLSGYLLVFRHDGGEKLVGPAPLKGPSAIHACNAELRHLAGDWRIFRLENSATFLAQP